MPTRSKRINCHAEMLEQGQACTSRRRHGQRACFFSDVPYKYGASAGSIIMLRVSLLELKSNGLGPAQTHIVTHRRAHTHTHAHTERQTGTLADRETVAITLTHGNGRFFRIKSLTAVACIAESRRLRGAGRGLPPSPS